VPSLRENVSLEIHQERARAKRADKVRRQPKKEWAGAVKKEEGGGGARWCQFGLADRPRPREGKGEWAGRGGRRGGPRLGRIQSRARIQKEILFKFQLILEFGRILKNCTGRFRRKFYMGIFPKIFLAILVFYKNEI
jgi:hypothetical protein